jgi:hypothetical protein
VRYQTSWPSPLYTIATAQQTGHHVRRMLAMTLYNWILDAFLLDNNKPPSSFVGTYEDVFVPQRFDYDCVSGERYSYMLLLCSAA